MDFLSADDRCDLKTKQYQILTKSYCPSRKVLIRVFSLFMYKHCSSSALTVIDEFQKIQSVRFGKVWETSSA